MQFDELLDHSQPDTHTCLRTIGPGVCLTENLKYVRQERGVDSLPIVRHSQDNLIAIFLESHSDKTTARCELHRVVQQVPDDLLEPDRISPNEHQILGRYHLNVDLFAFCVNPHCLNGILDRCDRRNSLTIKLEFTAAQS